MPPPAQRRANPRITTAAGGDPSAVAAALHIPSSNALPARLVGSPKFCGKGLQQQQRCQSSNHLPPLRPGPVASATALLAATPPDKQQQHRTPSQGRVPFIQPMARRNVAPAGSSGGGAALVPHPPAAAASLLPVETERRPTVRPPCTPEAFCRGAQVMNAAVLGTVAPTGNASSSNGSNDNGTSGSGSGGEGGELPLFQTPVSTGGRQRALRSVPLLPVTVLTDGYALLLIDFNGSQRHRNYVAGGVFSGQEPGGPPVRINGVPSPSPSPSSSSAAAAQVLRIDWAVLTAKASSSSGQVRIPLSLSCAVTSAVACEYASDPLVLYFPPMGPSPWSPSLSWLPGSVGGDGDSDKQQVSRPTPLVAEALTDISQAYLPSFFQAAYPTGVCLAAQWHPSANSGGGLLGFIDLASPEGIGEERGGATGGIAALFPALSTQEGKNSNGKAPEATRPHGCLVLPRECVADAQRRRDLYAAQQQQALEMPSKCSGGMVPTPPPKAAREAGAVRSTALPVHGRSSQHSAAKAPSPPSPAAVGIAKGTDKFTDAGTPSAPHTLDAGTVLLVAAPPSLPWRGPPSAPSRRREVPPQQPLLSSPPPSPPPPPLHEGRAAALGREALSYSGRLVATGPPPPPQQQQRRLCTRVTVLTPLGRLEMDRTDDKHHLQQQQEGAGRVLRMMTVRDVTAAVLRSGVARALGLVEGRFHLCYGPGTCGLLDEELLNCSGVTLRLVRHSAIA